MNRDDVLPVSNDGKSAAEYLPYLVAIVIAAFFFFSWKQRQEEKFYYSVQNLCEEKGGSSLDCGSLAQDVMGYFKDNSNWESRE